MKLNGIDRVEIMVLDADKALDLFSNKLGMEFLELDERISKRDGFRSYVCPETHIHLIAPALPLGPNAPEPVRRNIELLKKHEAIFQALSFMVDELDGARAELIHYGIPIEHVYEPSSDYASMGLDDFAEIITAPESTLGLTVGLAAYTRNRDKENRYSKASSDVQVEGKIKAKSLDRVVIMVRDMKKALDFFSGKLGMVFRELSKEVQERDGNIGYVCHDTHVHLIQPRFPLPEYAPLLMKRGAEALKDKDAMTLVLIFKVDDPKAVGAELKNDGIDTLRTWEENSDYASLGMDRLVEVLVDPEKTLSIPLCFSKWDKC